MSKQQKDLWGGLNETARRKIVNRNYQKLSLADRVSETGVDAAELASIDPRSVEAEKFWIPGVEIFPRRVHGQRHRGVFGELVRKNEGVLSKIGLWPEQWSAARMFAQTAKGFHVHPPSIPSKVTAEKWLRRLFVDEPDNYALRPYEQEQWDVMFIVHGQAEMLLRDCRTGLAPRIMRLFIEGDSRGDQNNVGIVIPPGIAHAIRVEGSEDVIMIYGTSTSFRPEFEGRIASEIETLLLPESWKRFLSND